MVVKLLSPEFLKLIELIEKIEFGQIKITIQNKKPVRVDFAIKQIKLDEEFEEKIKVLPLI